MAPPTGQRPQPTGQRRFYAVARLALVSAVVGALALIVAGVRAGGATRVVELAGAVVLLVVAYGLLAVIAVSRAGDPER